MMTVDVEKELNTTEKDEYVDKDDDDLTKFDKMFEQIRLELTECVDPNLKNVMKRLDEILIYNVPYGKKVRGLAIVKFFRHLTPKDQLTEEKVITSQILGWCVEILQAYMLILDDIMDHSMTRRGMKCWYLNENVGVLAINDASLLKMSLFGIIKKYCSKHPCYLDIIDLYYNVSFDTLFGQVMDCLTTPDDKRPDFSLFTRKRYETIVKYKTSLYTFDLPARMAMFLAGINDEIVHEKAQRILLKIGHLFQAQDDYLDVFGDPKITGKIGTDIEDGKCSWIAVEAYQRMNEEQRMLFEKHYAVNDETSINIIKDLYEELNLKKVFKEYEKNEYKEIRRLIAELEKESQLKVKMFFVLLDMIYKRKK